MPNVKTATLVKMGVVLVGGFVLYRAVRSGASAVVTAVNPMSRDNLAHVAAENLVGAENLASASTGFFDFVDSVAEALGSENGINGVPGTLADLQRANTTQTTFAGLNSNG